MISPSIIISKGWEDYEDNQIDWEYIDHLQYCNGDSVWCNDDLDGLDDPREWSEYTNEKIFNLLEEKGEWFGHHYYDLYCQYEDSMELDDEQFSWEEEYTLYIDSCEDELIPPVDSFNLCEVIKRKDDINNKRKKNNKDYNTWRWNSYGCWWESRFFTHKFKRAEKVFTEEEYETYNCHEDEAMYGEFECTYSRWWDYDQEFYEEIGSGYLVHDDWKEYVDHTGKVLDKYGLMSKESEKEDQAYWDDKFFEEYNECFFENGYSPIDN